MATRTTTVTPEPYTPSEATSWVDVTRTSATGRGDTESWRKHTQGPPAGGTNAGEMRGVRPNRWELSQAGRRTSRSARLSAEQTHARAAQSGARTSVRPDTLSGARTSSRPGSSGIYRREESNVQTKINAAAYQRRTETARQFNSPPDLYEGPPGFPVRNLERRLESARRFEAAEAQSVLKGRFEAAEAQSVADSAGATVNTDRRESLNTSDQSFRTQGVYVHVT
jgi:hypothetical protein